MWYLLIILLLILIVVYCKQENFSGNTNSVLNAVNDIVNSGGVYLNFNLKYPNMNINAYQYSILAEKAKTKTLNAETIHKILNN